MPYYNLKFFRNIVDTFKCTFCIKLNIINFQINQLQTMAVK